MLPTSRGDVTIAFSKGDEAWTEVKGALTKTRLQGSVAQ
jgi:hypothetical protein